MKCKLCGSSDVFSHVWWKSEHTEDEYDLCETHHQSVGNSLMPLVNAGFAELVISEPKTKHK